MTDIVQTLQKKLHCYATANAGVFPDAVIVSYSELIAADQVIRDNAKKRDEPFYQRTSDGGLLMSYDYDISAPRNGLMFMGVALRCGDA